MKISVIIPSKNGLHHLQDCLPSVIKAAAKAPFETEIIVVDDNSTDGTLTKLPPIFTQVIFIKNSKSGVSSARNCGVKNSTGTWLLFIDNDVFLEEEFFLKTQKYLKDDIFCVDNKYFLCKKSNLIVLNGFDEIFSLPYSAQIDFVYRGLKRGWKGILSYKLSQQINQLPASDYFVFIFKNIYSNIFLLRLILKSFFRLNINIFINIFKLSPEIKMKRAEEKANSEILDKEIFNN